MYTFKKLLIATITLSSALSSAHAVTSPKKTDEPIPILVLGGGIAGLTAGLYGARAGHQTLVIEGDLPGGQLTKSRSVENWPGRLLSPGDDIAVDMKQQCVASGVTFASSKVTSVDFSRHPYTVRTVSVDGEKTEVIKALGVIVAMGTSPNYLGIPGEQDNWGEGVSNCAVCDGGLYRDKVVCVVGGGDAAIEEANYLSRIAKKVYIFVRREKMRAVDLRKETVLARPNVEVLYNHQISRINGKDDEGVVSVTLSNNRTRTSRELPVDGVFLAIGSTPNSNVLRGKIELDRNGYVMVDENQATSKPGVFAAGDLSDPVFKQAVSAAGDACKAALALNKYLEEREVTLASADEPQVEGLITAQVVSEEPLHKQVKETV